MPQVAGLAFAQGDAVEETPHLVHERGAEAGPDPRADIRMHVQPVRVAAGFRLDAHGGKAVAALQLLDGAHGLNPLVIPSTVWRGQRAGGVPRAGCYTRDGMSRRCEGRLELPIQAGDGPSRGAPA